MSSITDFTVNTTYNEGELYLTWTKASGVINQRILISGNRYAMSATDGSIVYEGSLEELTVSNLLPERFYYFTIFYDVNDGKGWVTDYKCKVSGITIKIREFNDGSVGMGDYLYNKMPLLYRRADREQDKGFQLKRFLQLFGSQLDILYSKINAVKDTVTDVDKTNELYLGYLSNYFGWKPNKEFPIDRQRMELKGVYEFYKNKGTLPGIYNFATAVSGYYVKVKEFKNMCFKTNTAGHRTQAVSDVSNFNAEKYTYNNTYPVICNVSRTGYWWQYRLNSVGVFIYGDITDVSPSGLTKTQIENKFNKIWRKLLPFNMDGYVIWDVLEDSDTMTLSDSYRNFLSDATYLKSNTSGLTTNREGVWTPQTIWV